MKQYIKPFVIVAVSIVLLNTLAKRVPVAGPLLGRALSGI